MAKLESYTILNTLQLGEDQTWIQMEVGSLDAATNTLNETITCCLDLVEAPVETKSIPTEPINKWMTLGLNKSLRT